MEEVFFNVKNLICTAPKGECDRKPEDVCKECKGCPYLKQTHVQKLACDDCIHYPCILQHYSKDSINKPKYCNSRVILKPL